MADRAFMTSNNVLTGLIKKNKREGKDITEHKKPIAPGDVDKLFSSGLMDTDQPASLQNKVFWDIMFNFGRRGQEGLQNLKKTSYVKRTDDKGKIYYTMAYNEVDKTHKGVNSREQNKDVKMYAEPGDDTCPVYSLDLYLSKLNPKCDALFQQPLIIPKPKVWYGNQPIGQNKLATWMSRLSVEAGLSRRYTNHCIRATVATGLKRRGVDNHAIMSVTGHRNQQSLESYVEGLSEEQSRDLSTEIHSLATGSRRRVPQTESVVRVESAPTTVSSTASSENTQIVVPSENRGVNPLSDLNLFANATVTGGTINISVVSGR